MKIYREWSTPNKFTFRIKPIKNLLRRYINGGVWVDPMSGQHTLVKITNDSNTKSKAMQNKDALDFLKEFKDESVDGVIFDPPYSYEMAKRLYKKEYKDTVEFLKYMLSCKNEIGRIIKPGGYAILCGWNSGGIGGKFDFDLVEVLVVCHGRSRNDTIVTVERRMNNKLEG